MMMRSWLVIERRGVKLYKPYYQTIKRIVELILCVIAVPFLLPVGCIIALAIRRDSPGPIFFVQERVGKGGQLFKMIKFRTMRDGADLSELLVRRDQGITEGYTAIDDDKDGRITPLGRFLRKFYLDEIPNLLNVIRGDMSLIGIRPRQPWEVINVLEWADKVIQGCNQGQYDLEALMDPSSGPYIQMSVPDPDEVIVAHGIHHMFAMNGASPFGKVQDGFAGPEQYNPEHRGLPRLETIRQEFVMVPVYQRGQAFSFYRNQLLRMPGAVVGLVKHKLANIFPAYSDKT